jgi:predicted oxidoreductase
MRPLADGPLYALPLMPGVATTAGGPRRDERARVLDQSGTPIAGLYAVGDTGSIWGHVIQHGCALTDGLVFGGIAAAAAVREAPSVTGVSSDELR